MRQSLSSHLKISFFGATDVGLVRDHNEDVWKAVQEKGLFLVADGMGGHLAGEVAAKLAVDKMAELFSSTEHLDSEDYLMTLFKQVNSFIHQQGRSKSAYAGMGTTLCCLYVQEDRVVYGHVGDSRIYRLRKEVLNQLTEDHSFVKELVGNQLLSPEEVNGFAYKHILTQAIGTSSDVEPAIKKEELHIGDLFLICSDGLSNFVTDQEILTTLTSPYSLEERGNRLIDLAKNHGGGDNVTVLLINVDNHEPHLSR